MFCLGPYAAASSGCPGAVSQPGPVMVTMRRPVRSGLVAITPRSSTKASARRARLAERVP